MILEAYITLLALSLILIGLGYFVDIKLLSMIGCMGLFFLGLVLTGNSVTYKSGQLENYTLDVNSTVTAVSTTFSYSTLSDTTTAWFGRYLAFAGALSFALVLISSVKRDKL